MQAPNLTKKGVAIPLPLPPGKQSEVYTTRDAFDKVTAFYKRLYKEFPMRRPKSCLPDSESNGPFLILDGGKDLWASKYWMKIQRP